MKTKLQLSPRIAGCLLAALAGTVATNLTLAAAAEESSARHEVVIEKNEKSTGNSPRKEIFIRTVESGDHAGPESAREVPWLGVSTDEASEVLASHLGLEPGVGLIVTHVAADSPAAKAGFQKNDVLVEFGNQQLVHPAQLRKLVRARKEGDVVQITLYRAGKKQTISATLGKTKVGLGLLGEEGLWRGNLDDVKEQLRELRIGETVRQQMKQLRESLGNIREQNRDVEVEIRRGMHDAQKGLQEALRHLHELPTALEPAADVLKQLARSGVHLDKNASVVVHSTGHATKSLVQADDSGTIVIVSNPNRRLTVHDAAGELVFDGEIETAEQQDKVPRDVWKKVEPLLEKMNAEPPLPPLPPEPPEPPQAFAPPAPPAPVHAAFLPPEPPKPSDAASAGSLPPLPPRPPQLLMPL